MWSSAVTGLGPSLSPRLYTPQVCCRSAARSPQHTNLHLLSIFLLLISLASAVTAQGYELEAAAYDASIFRRLESKGQIFFDRRSPPPLPRAAIERRQDNNESSTGSTSASTTSSSSSTATSTGVAYTTANITTSVTKSSSSASQSATSVISLKPTATEISPSGTIVPSALPSPFDSSLGSNFTSQSCPDFFNSFLSNKTFQSCVPVSLLLQNSKSFFTAARSPVILRETLDTACAVSLPICQPFMASLAAELISDSCCGADYGNRNPLVVQAYAGLVAYEPVYQATCLNSNETGNYCFADAITNQLNPSDAYPYYATLGLNLPPASHPTCSKCLQNTMSIFAVYAEDKNQPLATTYTSTAQQIDVACGAKFANATIPVGTRTSTSAAGKNHIVDFFMTTVVVFVAFTLA